MALHKPPVPTEASLRTVSERDAAALGALFESRRRARFHFVEVHGGRPWRCPQTGSDST